VRAKEDGGFSDFSNVASVARTGEVRVTAATTGLDLDPDGYIVTVSVVTSTGVVPVASDGVSTNGTVTFTGLHPGDSYRLTLSGIATNCAANTSQTISLVAGATAEVRFDVSCVAITTPAAPRLDDVAGFFRGTMYLVWWDNSFIEDGFKIERCLGGNCGDADFTLIAITGPHLGNGQTTYWDAGLQEGTVYTYRLRATNKAGDSAPVIGAGRTCSEEVDEMGPCY
jgi:hypothetical protein